MNQGGSFMWIIAVIGILGLIVIIERVVFYFYFHNTNSEETTDSIIEALKHKDFKKAKESIAHSSTPLNILLRTGITEYEKNTPWQNIQKKLEETAVKQIPRLQSRLNSLGLFANVSTLAGLLGTIFGLQVSFSSLQIAEGADKATALANGISQAMNTTALGLIIAIPCMIAYTQLGNKQKKLSDDLDTSTMKLMNYLESAK